MAQKTIIKTNQAPLPVGPYSQAIKAGSILFCSGQIAIDPTSNEVKMGDVKDQAKLVLENCRAVLKAGGADFSNVVKTTIFLKNMTDFAAVNEVYSAYFQTEPPARSTIQVAGLPKNVDVEIEMTAVI